MKKPIENQKQLNLEIERLQTEILGIENQLSQNIQLLVDDFNPATIIHKSLQTIFQPSPHRTNTIISLLTLVFQNSLEYFLTNKEERIPFSSFLSGWVDKISHGFAQPSAKGNPNNE
jgi:hypothetical protein